MISKKTVFSLIINRANTNATKLVVNSNMAIPSGHTNKVLVLSHNYPPDLGPASFRIEALVKALIKKGYQVTVVTSYPNRYENYETKENCLTERNLTVFRKKAMKQSNNLILRSFAYLDFFLKSYFTANRIGKETDLVVATTPQILTGYLGKIISKKYKKPFVLDVRDLWPDTMIELNILRERSIIFKLLKKLEFNIYKQADHIVINTPGFEDYFRKVTTKKTTLVTNGLDDYIYEYFKNNGSLTNVKPPYKVIYAGNLGIAQDIDILTRLPIEVLSKFEFVLIGNGSQKNAIEKHIKQKKLEKYIRLVNPMNRLNLLEEYNKGHAFFVHLIDIDMFKRAIPSKVFEFVATNKPLVYGLKGVGKEILDELKAGYSYAPNDKKSLSSALEELYQGLTNSTWAGNDRQQIEEKYLRSVLTEKFVKVIESVLQSDK